MDGKNSNNTIICMMKSLIICLRVCKFRVYFLDAIAVLDICFKFAKEMDEGFILDLLTQFKYIIIILFYFKFQIIQLPIYANEQSNYLVMVLYGNCLDADVAPPELCKVNYLS